MKKILVVDDMAIFREPIAASLRREGYESICASDGRQALNLLCGQRPDLILLDIAMPVMDGLSLLRAIRKQPNLRNIPVIMLTALSERETLTQAIQVGVQGYLLKSQFSLDDLLERVRNGAYLRERHLCKVTSTDDARSLAGVRGSQTGCCRRFAAPAPIERG